MSLNSLALWLRNTNQQSISYNYYLFYNVSSLITLEFLRTPVQHTSCGEDRTQTLSFQNPCLPSPCPASAFFFGAEVPVFNHIGKRRPGIYGRLCRLRRGYSLQGPHRLTHFHYKVQWGGFQPVWSEQARSTSIFMAVLKNALAMLMDTFQHQSMGRDTSSLQ